MLKLLIVGVLGCVAALSGIYAKHTLDSLTDDQGEDGHAPASVVQVKTEMTGSPVIADGRVLGYIVFQVSSTVDVSKLPAPDFAPGPYLLDAAVRASFDAAEKGVATYDSVYLEHLTQRLMTDANRKLGTEAVLAVNIEAFNYVPKEDIRGNVVKNTGEHGKH